MKRSILSTVVSLLLIGNFVLFSYTILPVGAYPSDTASWTILLYFDGDQSETTYSLAEKMKADVRNLANVGSTDEVHFLVLQDLDGMNDSMMYYVHQHFVTVYSPSMINASWGDEVNMGDPATLQQFMEWGIDHYPADHYNLYLNNHGGGWYGICADEHPSYDILNVSELSQVCSSIHARIGKRIDVVSMDACLMAMTEVAYALCEDVHYLVASEGFIRTHETLTGLYLNWHVDQIYGYLAEHPWMSPVDVCLATVETFQTDTIYILPPSIIKPQAVDTISAIDLSYLPLLAFRLDQLAEILLEQSLIDRIRMQWVFLQTQSFSGGYDFVGVTYYPTYVDAYDFAYNIKRYSRHLQTRRTAQLVMDAVDDVVILERHGTCALRGEHPDAHGISLYHPYRSWVYDQKYSSLTFAQHTHWDEYLCSLWS